MKFSIILSILITALKVHGDRHIIVEKTDLEDLGDECENKNEEMGCLMPKSCWITCDNMHNPIQCKAPCKPGCDCITGFVRDKKGNCIHPKECPNNEISKKCPPNQEIGCDSPCYPNTCENSYYNGPQRICTAICIKQCVCKKGWTFKSNNEKYCIPIEKCHTCCPVNREFKECGPYNPISCEDPYAEQEICDENCNRGCFCRDGLVEDGYGNCIPPKKCPNIVSGIDKNDLESQPDNCPSHQEIGCENPCNPNTCENTYYRGPSEPCPEKCSRQCVCQEGWTFKSTNERICIPVEKCPICCPFNREFKECGPYNPRSCDDPFIEEDICEENCVRGCFCKDVLVEDGYGNCIPPDNCPLKCGPNEIEDPCVNPCQPTCDNPYPSVCPSLVCNKGCVCTPPYIRDTVTNECVDRYNCIRHPCLQNETYVTFGFDCKKCSNYEWIRCDPIPAPQCVCNDPLYVRDDETGYCISPEDCPRSTTTPWPTSPK